MTRHTPPLYYRTMSRAIVWPFLKLIWWTLQQWISGNFRPAFLCNQDQIRRQTWCFQLVLVHPRRLIKLAILSLSLSSLASISPPRSLFFGTLSSATGLYDTSASFDDRRAALPSSRGGRTHGFIFLPRPSLLHRTLQRWKVKQNSTHSMFTLN